MKWRRERDIYDVVVVVVAMLLSSHTSHNLQTVGQFNDPLFCDRASKK